jgi:hypothetical protein
MKALSIEVAGLQANLRYAGIAGASLDLAEGLSSHRIVY